MDLEGCVDRAVALLTSEARARFSREPLETLREDLGLTVAAADHLTDAREGGGACDGVSFLKDGVILYAPTSHSRRENFTLAHELGHWLVERDPGIYDWLADQNDPSRSLETICDRIAQRLLLPESAAAAIVGSGQVAAEHMITLYNTTQASRSVCAIALAKLLPSMGAIAIVDRYDGTVRFASVYPDPHQGWPTVFPWRGDELSEGHPLLRLTAGESRALRISWQTPWGSHADFYVDAVGEEKCVIAVFSDRDLWGIERFRLPIQREFDKRPMLMGFCCGSGFERRGYPCSTCGNGFCPQCEQCRCERDTNRSVVCGNCFYQYLPHLITDGLCEDCRS